MCWFNNIRCVISSAMVLALDQAFADVITALDAQNMLQNSIIIFSTDNGADPAGRGGSNLPLR